MTDINQPASSFYKLQQVVTADTFSVISQEGTLVKVALRGTNNPEVGTILIFENNVRGIVKLVTPLSLTVVLDSPQVVTVGSQLPLYNQLITTPIRVSSKFGFGGLSVKCNYLSTHQQGYLGWSLYGPDGSLLVTGNDLSTALSCELPIEGTWSAGRYVLRARAFSNNNLQPLATAETAWLAQAPVSIFRKGNYDDNSPVLILK